MDIITDCCNYAESIKFEVPIKQGRLPYPAEITASLEKGEDPLRFVFDIVDYYKVHIYTSCTNKMDEILSHYKGEINVDLTCVRSRARVMKQCSKIVVYYYNIMINVLTKYLDEIMSNPEGHNLNFAVIYRFLTDVNAHLYDIIGSMVTKLYCKYTTDDRMRFGPMLMLIDAEELFKNHDMYVCRNFIIPDTDITVFEFLFMDLNLTNLPILNHEELIVEKFKKLEHLIRDRCKKLKKMYDIHLIFNEKRFNFPEDCTNHILEYCPDEIKLSECPTAEPKWRLSHIRYP